MRLQQGNIVSKCDLRYRDLRYQIDETFDLALSFFQHISQACVLNTSYHKTHLCFHLRKGLNLTLLIGQGQEMY